MQFPDVSMGHMQGRGDGLMNECKDCKELRKVLAAIGKELRGTPGSSGHVYTERLAVRLEQLGPKVKKEYHLETDKGKFIYGGFKSEHDARSYRDNLRIAFVELKDE